MVDPAVSHHAWVAEVVATVILDQNSETLSKLTCDTCF